MIPKLKRIGLSDAACDLICSYMTNRRNACKVQGMISEFLAVHTGIGEGSVLGPLIFLICILETSMMANEVKDRMNNDQEDDVDASTACFADDSTVLLATTDNITMQETMNVTSEIFGQYFSCQGMKEENICFYP